MVCILGNLRQSLKDLWTEERTVLIVIWSIILVTLWLCVPTAIYILLVGVALTLLKAYCMGGKCTNSVRLAGNTVIITGANTGIGKITATDLCARGARVVLACRDVAKARTAASEIRAATGGDVESMELDLASLSSVRRFVELFLAKEDKLDILINNAGVMMCPFSRTEDGFELQMGTNHLGHFLLTNLLLDRLQQSPAARIVNLSSEAHRFAGAFDFHQMNKEENYGKLMAYGQSKLANILFTRELARKLEGTKVTTYSVHPGSVRTELGRHILGNVLATYMGRAILAVCLHLPTKSPQQGAQTSIYCATEPALKDQTGKYYSDCGEKAPTKHAQSDSDARKLWDISAKLVHLESMK